MHAPRPRRLRSLLLLTLALMLQSTWVPAVDGQALQFGVSEALPFYGAHLTEDWANYLQERIGRQVTFVHRPSHNDILSLLVQGRLDFAWICPAQYRRHRQEIDLLATPIFQESARFQVVFLVSSDLVPPLESLEDLEDKVVAFAEPDTNLGSALIKRALRAQGHDPEHYFRRVLYTGDHERVIRAIADGLAHGGAVIDQAWEIARRRNPELADRARVIWRSGWRPMPPIVASRSVASPLRHELEQALLAMEDSPQGNALLARLHFDRFVPGDETLYGDEHPEGSGAESLATCGE